MKFEELERIGGEMGEREVRDSIRGLMADRRFGAVVRLVREMKEQYADAGCAQGMATHHGCLAHAAGSRHALLTLEGRLREIGKGRAAVVMGGEEGAGEV